MYLYLFHLQTAQAAFSSVTQDEVFSVRRMALAVFAKHPQRHRVTREAENDILRFSKLDKIFLLFKKNK
jgi:hypothetical protein